MAYLFGPVPSRRYGRSLGIDLVPMKTCCYDCLFCQLGPTPQTTCDRRDYVPVEAVLAELREYLARDPAVDMLTLCGSGEPTLHLHFGEVLRWIRAETGKPSLLMSNGALFADPEVRADAALADRVKISLHFWDEASFRQTVRPHASLTFAAIVAGWTHFRAQYAGKLDLEFFAMPGINDAPEQLDRIQALAGMIAPDTVTVNSAARPPADSCVKAVPPEALAALQQRFAAVAAARKPAAASAGEPYSEAALLALARRHPLTPEAFADHFGVSAEEIRRVLRQAAATDPYAARALMADAQPW